MNINPGVWEAAILPLSEPAPPPPLAAQLLVLQFDTGSTPTHLNCCDRKQLVIAIKSKRERNTRVAPRHLPGGVEKIPLHLP